MFNQDEIIFLLGAGASVDAGIPDSKNMINEIETFTISEAEWKPYRELYLYIRGSISFADGLDGKFGQDIDFNIERLVNILDELQKKEKHSLYPFVGAWSPKLSEVAGIDFGNVRNFRNLIIQTLRNKWITLSETECAEYYNKLLQFQEEYSYPLRVFSLNYDLCVEQTCGKAKVQRGFTKRTWDWRVFDDVSENPPPIFLYKLHGSLDWYFKDGQVQYADVTPPIKPEEFALIFGTSYKLQYLDPFLFLAYELRRWTLKAVRIIICIGFGFNDEHINGILGQALRQNKEQKLLAVIGPEEPLGEKDRIASELKVDSDRIIVEASGAKLFLESGLSIAKLASYFEEPKSYAPKFVSSGEKYLSSIADWFPPNEDHDYDPPPDEDYDYDPPSHEDYDIDF